MVTDRWRPCLWDISNFCWAEINVVNVFSSSLAMSGKEEVTWMDLWSVFSLNMAVKSIINAAEASNMPTTISTRRQMNAALKEENG